MCPNQCDTGQLYYCSQRYYDPVTCQFISRDPALSDAEESSYQYCDGDPVGNSDPSGLWSKMVSLSLKTSSQVNAWNGRLAWAAWISFADGFYFSALPGIAAGPAISGGLKAGSALLSVLTGAAESVAGKMREQAGAFKRNDKITIWRSSYAYVNGDPHDRAWGWYHKILIKAQVERDGYAFPARLGLPRLVYGERDRSHRLFWVSNDYFARGSSMKEYRRGRIW